MRKAYVAPLLEIEIYELNSNIASHCGIVVTNGPSVGGKDACGDFPDPFTSIEEPVAEINAPPYNVQFYDDTTCDCYTTGSDYGYWQS